MAEPMIADQAERDRALDPSRSFIVQAPAGSGKTELLVRRFLRLLPLAQRPEEILAITFTRKAAAAMRRRVLAEIPDPAPIAHRLRIETIDALCLSLARQLPVPAQFGAAPAVVEDARELYLESAFLTLRDLASPRVVRLLSHLDNNFGQAASLLAQMLRRRDHWLRKTGRAPTRAELEAGFAAERRRLLERARAFEPRASFDFAAEVLTKEGTWRKRSEAAQSLSGNEPLREALAALLGAPPERYEDSQWEALEAMLALLPAAVAQLKLVFAARGECDFTEIAQGAVRALGTADEPTDLLLSLDSKINHVLVDEFQDTSISQWELLERLTAGWQQGDGRTLFLVGDPMQSIYRFREAEVGLFLKARREGLPSVKLEPITLRTNFRSQAGIVEWVNECFENVFPKIEDQNSGAVPYSPSAPKHPRLPGEAVQWRACADPDAEAAQVVRLAREAEGGCAILVRERGALAKIVPALKAAGVRFRAIEIEKLGERQVVQDLFALTRALTHLADRVAWLAILRAPWVGLDLRQLSVLFEGKRLTVWESIQDIPELSRFRRALAPAIADRLRGTLRDRVEGVWLALGGPACVADPTDLEDAEAYLDALEKLEHAGEVDFARLAELLEELYAQPDLAAGENDLQIMTIHKAKGLEFGTVLVPGLERALRPGDPQLLRWKELVSSEDASSPRKRGPSLLLAPINETGEDKEPAYEYLKTLDREAEDTEAARLLYVAATRAKHRLHLLASVKSKMPPKRSLLACAWPVAEPLYAGLTPPEEKPSTPVPTGPTVLTRLPRDWTPPAPPADAAWTPPHEGRDEEQIPFDWAREAVRHAGILVHDWLQKIATDQLRGWDAARVAALRPRIRADLARRAVAPTDLDRATGLVVTALANTLSDERGRWLLGPHPVAISERRLRIPGRSLRIDRYIQASDGTKWVVDYKISPQEGGGLEKFLNEQQERYAEQLNTYAAVVGGAKRGLYFPLHGRWREWSG